MTVVAPVKTSPVNRGSAALEVEFVAGESAVTAAFARSPMKLLTPRSRGQSVWVYTSSFGGGLVAGDQTRLDLRISKGARCFLGTQASTKIYRNPSRLPCSHATHASLAEESLLVFAPDPVQAFADSSYTQRQEFHLAAGAGLVLVDWFTSGRAARGERWAFHRFQSRNDVFVSGERIFLDSILLDSSEGALTSPMSVGRFNCFAMLLLAGEPMRAAANRLLQGIASKPVERKASLAASASPIRHGVVLRIAGEQVEAVGREIHHYLDFLCDALGDDPWTRKW